MRAIDQPEHGGRNQTDGEHPNQCDRQPVRAPRAQQLIVLTHGPFDAIEIEGRQQRCDANHETERSAEREADERFVAEAPAQCVAHRRGSTRTPIVGERQGGEKYRQKPAGQKPVDEAECGHLAIRVDQLRRGLRE